MPATSLKGSTESTITIPVIGMSCAACQSHVERTLRQTSGVADATVNLMTHSARVVFDPALAGPETLVAAVQSAGYDSAVPENDASPGELSNHPAAEKQLRIRAFATLASALIAMLLSMPLMRSTPLMNSPVQRLLMAVAPMLYRVPAQTIEFVLLVLTLIGMLWAGGSIYRAAWTALLHRSTNMNTLVALGTLAALFYSLVATFAPGIFLRHGLRPEVYYESVLFILAFLLLGRWLDARSKRRTLDALRAFTLLQPSTARILGADGSEADVPVAFVRLGNTIILRPGERIPVDGVVLSGTGSVDESLITGESLPVTRSSGDRLIGGSLNYDGSLEYRATSLGADSVLGQMLRMMEEAQSSRAPTQQLADRVSAVFVPIVLGLAALTFILWAVFDRSDMGRAFAVSIAVLVIACPCAMGLAVPAALTVAIGRAAQLGILIKSGEALERLARVDTVVLDKTGTLTVGKPAIVGVHPVVGISEEELLRLAASVEQRSEHPLARAVLDRATAASIAIARVAEFRAIPGRGVIGQVDGHDIAAGNRAFLKELNIALPASATDSATDLFVTVNGIYSGRLTAEDQVRPGAADAIQRLKRRGMSIVMLTGDTASSAQRIAEHVGIGDVHAGLLPQQKLEHIRALQASGRVVAMVGDGINDAAALAQSDAGLAIGAGADLAREAGDAILLRGEPRSIADALDLARSTRRIMHTNLAWALGYNVFGIPIAAGALFPFFGILLSPAVASAAMALSSISVLANSLRLRSFQPR